MPTGGSPSKLPLYLTQTGRERNEFLRGLGLAEYDDINLFNLLCAYAVKRGAAKILVSDFLAVVTSWARTNRKPNLMGGAAKATLRRLATALERNGYAQTRDQMAVLILREGDRKAGRGERAVMDIEQAYQRMENDPVALYPGTSEVSIPPTALVPVSYTEFTRTFVQGQAESTKVVRITFGEDVDLLVTPPILGRLLEIARRRVHFYIQNNAGLYNYVMAEIRKIPQFRHVLDQGRFYAYLEGRAETSALFWVYLGLAVVRSRNEDVIEPKLRPGRMALYQSAYLLNGWWQAEHRLEQERRQRKADEEALVAWVERSGRGYTLEEMADIRDEGGRTLKDKYPDTRAFLVDTLERLQAEAAAAGHTPSILAFGDQWVHRSAVVPRLEEELRASSEYCRRSLETDLRAKLERGVVDDPVVSGDTGFAQAVTALVDSKCPRLATMLKKPQLVHTLITELAELNPALYRTHAELFEAPDRPFFKRPDLLLGLDRMEMVSHIVAGMSLIRRFLLRRRFRLKRPVARPAPTEATRKASAEDTTTTRSPTAPEEATAMKTARPRHQKPKTVVVERKRKKGPKTMDEAMDKLKEAMSKRSPP